MGVNGAWIDAHLTSDTPPLAGGFDGDRLPFVPKVSFSLNADYEWKLSDSTTAFVGGTIAYTGSQRDNFNVSDIVGVDPGRVISSLHSLRSGGFPTMRRSTCGRASSSIGSRLKPT